MLLKNRTLRLILFAAPAVALAAAALFLALGPGSGDKAQADFPHPGLNVSFGIGSSCDSDAGPTTCVVAAGATATLDIKLTSLGGVEINGYDSVIDYDTVTFNNASAVQTGAGTWTGCVFATGVISNSPTEIIGGCTVGITAPPAGATTYTGVLYHVDFTCPASAPESPVTFTLVNGAGFTSILDPNSQAHGEAANETLTVTCGAPIGGGTDTPVPPTIAATNTPVPTTPATVGPTNTPTNTPTTGPTNTPRPTNTPMPTVAVSKCDVNGDGHITSEDGLWILWKEAGIVDHVPLPENADCNHDSHVNSIDALFILWHEGGRI
jgi:hypothetical protein